MRKACLTQVLVLVVAMTALFSNAVSTDANREYQLKAAYLLNFARFIYWPKALFSSEIDVFRICVYGESPFAENLNHLLSKKVQGRSIKINQIENLNNVAVCHILFVCKSNEDDFHKISSYFPQHVLTVSDVKGFSSQGGMIEFVRFDNKIKFEINVAQSTKSGIKYRSQLLEVAEQLR